MGSGLLSSPTKVNLAAYSSINTELVLGPLAAAIHLPLPTAAAALDVVSSSANDDGSPAGTGIRTIRIYGLDSSYKEQTEDVILDGTTPVTTVKSFLRVNRLAMLTVGSGGVAAGNIDASPTGGTNILARIPTGENISTQLTYTVPDGKTGRLVSLAFIAVTKDALVKVRASMNQVGEVMPGLGQIDSIYVIAGAAERVVSYAGQLSDLPTHTDLVVAAAGIGGAGSLASRLALLVG